jgi:hypothetical protein
VDDLRRHLDEQGLLPSTTALSHGRRRQTSDQPHRQLAFGDAGWQRLVACEVRAMPRGRRFAPRPYFGAGSATVW